MLNPVSSVLEPASAAMPCYSRWPSQEVDRLEQFAKLQSNDDKEKKDATRALLDTFKAKSLAGKVTGILPINVAFPAFGPSIFLVSELTSENQSPAARIQLPARQKGRCAMKNI